MIRLPPFIYTPIDGCSYVKIFSELASKESIMQVTNKNLFIIPLDDARLQIVIVPLKSVANKEETGLCDKVRTVMKDIDPLQIKKLRSLTVPSFKIELKNQKIAGELGGLKLGDDEVIAGGTQSVSIELISGLPCKGALR